MSDYDVIVIGSGAGGLSAAVPLAQAGKKVLVLEQHYLPGGWCHTFNLGGYRYSPGVHYIGELQEGGRMRAIYEGLGLGQDLTFFELNPDGFEHVTLGKERFDIPRGKERFSERLSQRFPRERRGIQKYMDAIDGMANELGESISMNSPIDWALFPLRAPKLTRWGWRNAQVMLDHYLEDPLLKGILSAQAGDHGLPPSQVAGPMHAAVMAHYFHGGYYPKGGGGSLPRAYIRALRRAGGEIMMRAKVQEILLEGRRAIGVRLADGKEIRADVVISNADPGVTFNKLIGRDKLSDKLQRKLDATRYSVAACSMFMAVDLDMRALGFDSGNYWIYDSPDVDGIYTHGLTARGDEAGAIPGCFLTVTTLKDPSKNYGSKHTLEMFAFVGYDAYRAWKDSSQEDRPEAYRRMKAKVQERMIAAASKVIPGFRESLVFCETGTPLTNDHYVAATDGNLYGNEKTVRQVGRGSFPLRTEFENLYMCGASTLSHGVMGASVSGLVTARLILGCRVRDLLKSGQKPITLHGAEAYAAELAAQPLRASA